MNSGETGLKTQGKGLGHKALGRRGLQKGNQACVLHNTVLPPTKGSRNITKWKSETNNGKTEPRARAIHVVLLRVSGKGQNVKTKLQQLCTCHKTSGLPMDRVPQSFRSPAQTAVELSIFLYTGEAENEFLCCQPQTMQRYCLPTVSECTSWGMVPKQAPSGLHLHRGPGDSQSHPTYNNSFSLEEQGLNSSLVLMCNFD